MIYGETLRAERERLKLSQTAMAGRLDIARESYAAIEAGRRPMPPHYMPTVYELTGWLVSEQIEARLQDTIRILRRQLEAKAV